MPALLIRSISRISNKDELLHPTSSLRVHPSSLPLSLPESLQFPFGALQVGPQVSPQVSQRFTLFTARSVDLLEFLLCSTEGQLDLFDLGFGVLSGLLRFLQCLPGPVPFLSYTRQLRIELR